MSHLNTEEDKCSFLFKPQLYTGPSELKNLRQVVKHLHETLQVQLPFINVF